MLSLTCPPENWPLLKCPLLWAPCANFPLTECTALTSIRLRHNSNPKMKKFLFYFHYLIIRLPSPFQYELLEERKSDLIIFEFPEPNTGLSHSKCLINVCGKNETRP